MKYIIKNIIPAAALALTLGMTSCTGDLDVDPIDPNLSTEVSLDGLYLKCYANLALPGNGGANGDSDIDGYDGGTAGFIRQAGRVPDSPAPPYRVSGNQSRACPCRRAETGTRRGAACRPPEYRTGTG